MTRIMHGIEVVGRITPEFEKILSPDALEFLAQMHRKFNPTREKLLAARAQRRVELEAGKSPDFLDQTQSVRQTNWTVGSVPPDLMNRKVEITGPVERKMMINALNSGANVFMADFEDSLSPTWTNVIEGQQNCKDAIRRTLTFSSLEGKEYKLNEKLATLVVRPRGWHLLEKHVMVEGAPISASLFDFGLYFFHNARELITRGSGPYFYLPKMESHLEARLWNDVFKFAQQELQIEQGTIRATVLIETILAAFEMDEILYELKEHAAGLNAGRWDYLFSIIKKFSSDREFLLPDRSQLTMQVPFMRAYCQLLVKTCHRRDAHAMGGMAAFIPSRKDAELNARAMTKVREDKQLEAATGFDGTWVAHPDLVPVAREKFDQVLGDQPHQKSRLLEDVSVNASQLIDLTIAGGKVTETGFTNNVNVALQYIESWLRGVGAAAIHNLMEDAATAEIARAQIWQWIKNSTAFDDGRKITSDLYKQIRDTELAALTKSDAGRFHDAAEILDHLIKSDTFVEFLTVPAYEYLKA